MTHLSRWIFFISFIFLLSASAFAVGDNVPGWLRQAASVNPPTYEKEVQAVVLQNEQQVALGNDGKIVTTENYAVKILTREGKSFAVASVYYLVSSGKVRDIDAWLIRPDGSTKSYDKKSVLDIISDPDDVYNEGRVKIIDASDDVDTGYIFGYTVISDRQTAFLSG